MPTVYYCTKCGKRSSRLSELFPWNHDCQSGELWAVAGVLLAAVGLPIVLAIPWMWNWNL